jgi:hypothetical protein
MAQQVQSLAEDVEAAVSAAMGKALPSEVADEDPLVRRSDHADFQSNVVLSVAKRLRRKPRDLALELRAHLAEVSWIAAVQVSGPGFLNITLEDGYLVNRLSTRREAPRLGVPGTQAGQTAVVDYSAPNVAKEMHVGHLRSTLIGDALVRVLGYLGAKVVSDRITSVTWEPSSECSFSTSPGIRNGPGARMRSSVMGPEAPFSLWTPFIERPVRPLTPTPCSRKRPSNAWWRYRPATRKLSTPGERSWRSRRRPFNRSTPALVCSWN